jgi:uncharacterized membrane protein YgcG
MSMAAMTMLALLMLAVVAAGPAEAAGGTRGTSARLNQPALVAPGNGASAAGPGGSGEETLAGQAGSTAARGHRTTASFRQIILPDLLIVAPKGLTASQVRRLRAIAGVRSMITFDGAEITAAGRPVSVIGVNPATFRSWVPLRTASDQAFWTALANGDFVAAGSASQRLKLRPGSAYRLVGASAQRLTFGMAARLNLAGVDLMVDQAESRKLGLVHQVAGLISAPGVSTAQLTREVTKILGPAGRIEQLSGQLPASAGRQSPGGGSPGGGSSGTAGGRPSSYIQLFKASAAAYCPGLSWTVLAAIGQIESADGTNMGPSIAGALGPMQFLPSTWAQWGIDAFGETGPPNVMDPYDAVPSAARLLCADGAAAGGKSLYNAIFDYNHADWYVNEVLALAAQYAVAYR